jgi:hypothetical protein
VLQVLGVCISCGVAFFAIVDRCSVHCFCSLFSAWFWLDGYLVWVFRCCPAGCVFLMRVLVLGFCPSLPVVCGSAGRVFGVAGFGVWC